MLTNLLIALSTCCNKQWVQNLQNFQWDEEEVTRRLDRWVTADIPPALYGCIFKSCDRLAFVACAVRAAFCWCQRLVASHSRSFATHAITQILYTHSYMVDSFHDMHKVSKDFKVPLRVSSQHTEQRAQHRMFLLVRRG